MTKMFQYINSEGKELWLCTSCKKTKSHYILIHYLRLIDQQESANIFCDECGPLAVISRDERGFVDGLKNIFWR